MGRPYEIIMVKGNTGYLNAPIIIPFYLTDASHCILMDTGTERMRERIVRTLEDNGLVPVGIICTHTHYDHFGNAGFLSKTYQCPIALPLGEAEVSRTIFAVKSHLFCFSSGQVAADPKMAAIPCVTDHVIRPKEKETFFCGIRFEIIHTKGHAIDHISIVTPDKVCYAGDVLMCGHAIRSAKLPYAFDLGEHLLSIEKMRNVKCSHLIMAHRGVYEAPFDALIDENLTVIKKEIRAVADLIDRQMTEEEIYKTIQRAMEIQIQTAEDALNIKRFLQPYLEYLLDQDMVKQSIRDQILCYEPELSTADDQ